MIRENQQLLNQFNVLTDAVAVFLAMLVSYWLRFDLFRGIKGMPFNYYVWLGVVAAALTLLIFAVAGLYESFRAVRLHVEAGRVVVLELLVALIVMAAMFVLRLGETSRWSVAFFYGVSVLLLVGKRAALRLLLQLLGREGLHPVLLKGQGVAALYGHPLLRECGDIDLYFPSEKEEREAAELMRRAGCRTERQPDGSVCYSWQGVEAEHHTRLFDLHNPLLRGYLSSLVGRHGFTDIRTEDGATLPVPAPLPDLLLLNAHLLKHIMGHGVGLRQFCDIGLWAQAYHDQLDWQRLHDQCAGVHAATFAAAAFRIARTYLDIDFDLPGLWDGDVDVEPLLHDTLCGGVYGSNDLTRLHSSTVTLNAVKASRTGEKSSVLRTVFPKREYLGRRYPYLKKRPYLLPVAWVQRIAHYAGEKQSGADNSASGSIKLAKGRIELMKRYGIIDEKK